MRAPRGFLTVLGFGLLPGLLPGQDVGDLDVVKTVDRSQQPEGTIVKDDYVSIKVQRLKIGAAEIPAYNVKEVTHWSESDYYKDAMQYLRREKYTAAARDFLDALKGLDAGEQARWGKEYCNYYAGLALCKAEKWDGYQGRTAKYLSPDHYFVTALEANPKSRFLLDARVRIALVKAKSRNISVQDAENALSKAEETIKKYHQEATNLPHATSYRRISDEAEAFSKLVKVEILARKAGEGGDLNPALNEARSLQTTSRGRYPELFSEAVFWELELYMKQKDYTMARTRAERLVNEYQQDNNPDLIPLMPLAMVTLGRVHWNKACDFEKQKQTIQALQAFQAAYYNFVQLFVVYFDKEQYLPEAYYFAGLCKFKLAIPNIQNLKPDALQTLFRQGYEHDAHIVAEKHWRTILRDFPRSGYAKNAEDGLKLLGLDPAAEEKAETKAVPKTDAKATTTPASTATTATTAPATPAAATKK